MKPFIVAEGIRKKYHPQSERELRVDSFEIRPGDFILIKGSNGAGKTTFLNILAGLDRPDAGSVKYYIDEEAVDIANLPDDEVVKVRRYHITFIPQRISIIPELSVLDNVIMPLLPLPIEEEALIREARKRLNIVGLGSKADESAGNLSGGQAQKLMIARALMKLSLFDMPEKAFLKPIKRPRFIVIFADEPFANIDDNDRPTLLDAIAKFVRRSTTAKRVAIIMASHASERIERRANRVIRMEGGKIISRFLMLTPGDSNELRRSSKARSRARLLLPYC